MSYAETIGLKILFFLFPKLGMVLGLRFFPLDSTSWVEPSINALNAKVAFDRFIVGCDFIAAARLAAKLTNGSDAFEDVQHG